MAEQRIDMNTATSEELTQLPGIGPVLAERIVTYRDTVRLFEEPSEITAVSGIGERTYRAMADHLTVRALNELARSAAGTPEEDVADMENTSAEPATGEKAPSEGEPSAAEEIVPQEEVGPEVEGVGAGQAMAEEELTFAEETGEEGAPTGAPDSARMDQVVEETKEEAASEAGDEPEAVAEEAPLDAREVPGVAVMAPEGEGLEFAEETGEERDLERAPVGLLEAPEGARMDQVVEETKEEAASEAGDEPEAVAEEVPLDTQEVSSEAEIEAKVEAIEVGETMLEEGLTLAEKTSEEEVPKGLAESEQMDHIADEAREEAAPGAGDVPEAAEGEAPPEAQDVPAEDTAAAKLEGGPAEEQADAEAAPLEAGLPPAQAAERSEPARSRSWWRRLSWLWTALLGGLLGMAFALLVFSGINGSLDIGHSRAVVDVRGRMNSMATDINSLQGDVDGLRKRLDALEELTVRMDRTEAAVGDLQDATQDLTEQADALDERVDTVVGELEAVSEEVNALQEEAEQTQRFFRGLQALLNDFFGDAEGESAETPTPTPEGK